MPIIGVLAAGGLAPLAPTIGTATAGDASATVTFTAPSWVGKGSGTVTYTATSSPDGLTGTSTSSPITVSGLTNGTAYTFTVKATTSYGVTGASSAASNSITPALQDAGAMFPIRSYVVQSGGTSSVTFSSIPSTYTHLQIRALIRSTRPVTTDSYFASINSDTGNYYTHGMLSTGSSASAYVDNGNPTYFSVAPGTSVSSNIFGSVVWDVLDYTNTNKNKTIRVFHGFDDNGTGQIRLTSSLWTSTNAINSISISSSNNIAQYSQFALYGIKA